MSAVEQLYAADIVEIVLDLPFPPSINRLWRIVGRRLIKSKAYLAWMAEADALVMASRAYPKRKITGPFSIEVMLADSSKADGDNCSFKAVLDWLQSRDVIRNDRDCEQWSGCWVRAAAVNFQCRITLRSLHQ